MIPYSEFCLSRYKALPNGANLIHIAIGIVGEVIELINADSRENTLEELGDLGFYLEIGNHYFPKHLSPEPGFPNSLVVLQQTLLNISGELLDYAKKHFIYGKPLQASIIEELIFLLRENHIAYIQCEGFRLEEVKGANTAKLLARYPEGYSDKDAQVRRDKK
jgi:hypothetical protein